MEKTMALPGANLKELEKRMEGALASLKSEFSGLRSGRASASLVEHIMVDAYGSNMPVNQVGSVNVPEPRMISVQVWDKALVSAVDRAIRDAGIGVNPVVDGTNVRIPIPPLTEERRKEFTKVAHKYAESARIAIRNVRREGMDHIKKAEGVGEDDQKRQSEQVQKLTDAMIKKVDEALAVKEAEIMQV
jgi:ribosome recycling factor